MNAAVLAPTGSNKQRIFIELRNTGYPSAQSEDRPLVSQTDIGIVKHHFEVGAGRENFIWK
ncbi:MAG: nitroreductase family protein [Enterocloster clostridioformis]